ncbi:unnamed protein product [Diplocarpon coronariae]|nr:hypothetical protein JHW43_008119 [Diplocarpon mali]
MIRHSIRPQIRYISTPKPLKSLSNLFIDSAAPRRRQQSLALQTQPTDPGDRLPQSALPPRKQSPKRRLQSSLAACHIRLVLGTSFPLSEILAESALGGVDVRAFEQKIPKSACQPARGIKLPSAIISALLKQLPVSRLWFASIGDPPTFE